MQEQIVKADVEAKEMSFLDSLFSFIDEVEAEELEVKETNSFTIETTEQANYIAKQLRNVRAEKAEAEATAKQQIEAFQERVAKWLEGVSSPLNYQEARYVTLLEQFASSKLEGSSKKSIKLIEGTLAFRKQPDKFEYNDEVLLDYAQAHLQNYVKHKPSVDKFSLKKDARVENGRLFLNGAEVLGVTITPQGQKFEVK